VGVLVIWQILESAVGAGYVGEARAEGHGSAMRRHEARQLDRRPVCLTDCVTGGRTLRVSCAECYSKADAVPVSSAARGQACSNDMCCRESGHGEGRARHLMRWIGSDTVPAAAQLWAEAELKGPGDGELDAMSLLVLTPSAVRSGLHPGRPMPAPVLRPAGRESCP